MINDKNANVKTFELNNSTIKIRPINVDDMRLEADFIRNLSPESRHYRFFGAMNNPADKMLCDIDGKQSMAFIAIEEINGKEVEIGNMKVWENY